MYKHNLQLTNKQLQVIFALLNNVRLGDSNEATSEISDFLAACEEAGIEDVLSNLDEKYGKVAVVFEYNEDEGLVLNLS